MDRTCEWKRDGRRERDHETCTVNRQENPTSSLTMEELLQAMRKGVDSNESGPSHFGNGPPESGGWVRRVFSARLAGPKVSNAAR